MNQKENIVEAQPLLGFGFILVILSLGGCGFLNKVEKILVPKDTDIEKILTETKSITITCKPGNIQSYIDEGWAVVGKKETEVPCTWKTKKATKRCDLELDKGCRITVPDTYGKEIKYSLERKKYD